MKNQELEKALVTCDGGYNIEKIVKNICFHAVYEETAGLMVNDPVLRTRKVRAYFCSLD